MKIFMYGQTRSGPLNLATKQGEIGMVYKGSAPRAANAARYARARYTTQPNVKETGIKGA